MSSLAEHCKDCMDQLGDEFKEVHLWLDELYKYNPGDWMHRSYRHNKESLETIREKWGDKGVQAAIIHIMKDFPGLTDVPNQKDYEDPNLIKSTDFYMKEEMAAKEDIRKNFKTFL